MKTLSVNDIGAEARLAPQLLHAGRVNATAFPHAHFLTLFFICLTKAGSPLCFAMYSSGIPLKMGSDLSSSFKTLN